MRQVPGFRIIDSVTGETLATLPRTVPIGATVDAYERAGFSVTWTWDVIETRSESSLKVVSA